MRIHILFIVVLALFACADAPSALSQPESTINTLSASQIDTIVPTPQPDQMEEKSESKKLPPPEDMRLEGPPKIRQQASSVTPTAVNENGTRAKETLPPGFTDIHALDPSILIDIKYATTDNFTHAQIYDCGRCLLRTEAAEALVKVHKSLKKKGLGLKMYDCYRPRPYQQRLWDKVPNPDYVTPPAKGSMHSRGAAVDLTLVDAQGKELDMGTPYDFFGKEAHTDYLQHPKKVLNNRNTLRDALLEQGFKGIRTEWWHFSYQKRSFPLSSALWECP